MLIPPHLQHFQISISLGLCECVSAHLHVSEATGRHTLAAKLVIKVRWLVLLFPELFLL